MLNELTLVEAIWLLIAIVGLVFAAVNLQAARSDVIASLLVENFRHDTRLVIARGAVQRHWVRVLVFLGWTGIGILFGFFNPPRVAGFAGLLVLLIGALGFAYNAFQESRERLQIAKLMAIDVAEEKVESHDEELAGAAETLDERIADVQAEHGEIVDSMKRTAENTERIARNTEPEK